jgi:LTXXQ motif family protein
MLKRVIAATAVLAIAGTSIVYAQQRFGEHRGFGDRGPRAEHRHRLSPQDLAAFTDARIAALKAGLELTPEQQKNWPGFEQALREVAQLRIQRIEARRQHRHHAQEPQAGETPQAQATPGNPFNRLQHRADSLAATSAALKKLADAGAPLYQSLTGDQQARFKILARVLRPHPWRLASNWRHGPWQPGGRGFGPRMQGKGHGHDQFGTDNGNNNGGGDDSQL